MSLKKTKYCSANHNYLNQSTLDALVVYILERIGPTKSIISVIASSTSPAFVLHRMGNTNGELVVTYTITRMSGDSFIGAVVFGNDL